MASARTGQHAFVKESRICDIKKTELNGQRRHEAALFRNQLSKRIGERIFVISSIQVSKALTSVVIGTFPRSNKTSPVSNPHWLPAAVAPTTRSRETLQPTHPAVRRLNRCTARRHHRLHNRTSVPSVRPPAPVNLGHRVTVRRHGIVRAGLHTAASARVINSARPSGRSPQSVSHD